MPEQNITASAPGSLMLLGEHAVLAGSPAIACAVNARMRVSLTPRDDRRVSIHSALATYNAPLDALTDDPKLRFVLEATRLHAAALPTGIHLDIASDFAANLGLGSSAAATVATLGSLSACRGHVIEPADILRDAVDVIRRVQGVGSGTDAAASVYGGLLRYHPDPPTARPLPGAPPIVVVYSGHKTPTVDVVRGLAERRRQDPALYDRSFARIADGVKQATETILRADWPALGRLFQQQQAVMSEMQLSTPAIEEILAYLQGQPGIWGAKISGSGLGDCVIGLGEADLSGLAYEAVPVHISSQGLEIET